MQLDLNNPTHAYNELENTQLMHQIFDSEESYSMYFKGLDTSKLKNFYEKFYSLLSGHKSMFFLIMRLRKLQNATIKMAQHMAI